MTYPQTGAGRISVFNEDLFCLNDGEFLNDVIIDFYLKYDVLAAIYYIASENLRFINDCLNKQYLNLDTSFWNCLLMINGSEHTCSARFSTVG